MTVLLLVLPWAGAQLAFNILLALAHPRLARPSTLGMSAGRSRGAVEIQFARSVR
jgi:hypothetical protein